MKPITAEEKLAWLRLARSSGIGPMHATKLIDRFGTAVEALAALPRLLTTGRWGEVVVPGREAALREIDAIAAAGATLLVRGDPEFPGALREIADPPVALVVRGEAAILRHPAIALVGARNASANGRLIADTMARDLAAAGLVVISGLARGIDTAAHKGALAASGRTVAAVAGGADIVYPEENAALMADIVETGCVVSERALGAVPRARDFPRRNRLIAGLALGVVVVEAAPKSGSLITARLAADQGREVMAVPGSPLDPRHRGTNQLLRDGAALVETAEDVLALLGSLPGLRPAPQARREPPEPRPRPPAPPGAATARAAPRRPAAAPGLAGTQPLAGRIGDVLGPDPVAVDELVRGCDASVAEVQSVLLELELEGRLERHPGNRVSLRAG